MWNKKQMLTRLFLRLGAAVSCERVLTSSWAYLLKCPVSLLGAVYFAITFGLSLMLAGVSGGVCSGVGFLLTTMGWD